MNDISDNISKGPDASAESSTLPLALKSAKYWAKRIGYRLWRISAEILVVSMSLAIAWLYALSFLLTQQSMDISAANSNIGHFFAEAVAGAGVDIPSMQLDWYPATDDIVFTGRDIVIKADDGTQMQSLPELKSFFPLSDVRRGVMIPRKIALTGGVVSWVENEKGEIKAGLGTPETLGRLGPIWEGQRASAESQGQLELNGITKVEVRGASAFYNNSRNGLNLSFYDIDFDFGRLGDVLNFDFVGGLTQSEKDKKNIQIPVALSVQTDSEFRSFDVNYRADGLNLSKVGPKSGRYADFKRLNTPATLNGHVLFSREEGLQSAEVDLLLGQGSIAFPNVESSYAFDQFIVSAGLNLGESEMIIDQIDLKSDRLNFTSRGELSDLGALNDGDVNSSPLFNLEFRDIGFDATPLLQNAMALVSVDLRGRFDADARTLSIERYRLDRGTHKISGQVFLKENEDRKVSQIKADGRLEGILSPAELLDIWPVKFANGARLWIERAILEGKVDNLSFQTEFGLNADEKLAEKTMNLDYTVRESTVKYISTMTPMSNVIGSANLSNNQLLFKLDSGNIGPVNLLPSQVEIPRLRPKGGNIIITANAAGQASDLLALINQEPFQFADKYNVNPSEIKGSGVVELIVTRPLLVFFDRNRIQYSAQGNFSGVSTPYKMGEHNFENADVSMTLDKTRLNVEGEINIGPWRTNIEMEEVFDEGLTPTQYHVFGPMDHTTLDELGLGFREFFDGVINMDVRATGTGAAVNSATIMADLANTEINFGEYWNKPINEAGTLTASLTRGEGGTDIQSITLQAPNLLMDGSLALTPSYALKSLSLDRLKISDLLEGSLQLQPDNSREVLSASFSGKKLDISSFIDSSFTTQTSSFDVPIMFTANVENLILDPLYIAQDASILYSHDGVAVTGLRLSAQSTEGPLSVNMQTDREKSQRVVDVSLPDAAKAATAFLGLDNLDNGQLKLNGTLPLPGEDGPYRGVAVIDEFTLQDAPILAKLLSLGSLTGLFGALSGDGLWFDKFEGSFQLQDGLLTVRDSRVYGPALGMTGEGDINLVDRSVDFDGALVPSYTANSLLGDIPIIGDIFVGKEGEGVFALSYTVTGSYEATQIAVNPLSALTPGFLRGIFRKQRDSIVVEDKPDVDELKSLIVPPPNAVETASDN